MTGDDEGVVISCEAVGAGVVTPPCGVALLSSCANTLSKRNERIVSLRNGAYDVGGVSAGGAGVGVGVGVGFGAGAESGEGADDDDGVGVVGAGTSVDAGGGVDVDVRAGVGTTTVSVVPVLSCPCVLRIMPTVSFTD